MPDNLVERLPLIAMGLDAADRQDQGDCVREAATRLAQLEAEVVRLRGALAHEVRNCPVCKGDGVAKDIMDLMMGKPEPHELKDCQRCANSRAALARQDG